MEGANIGVSPELLVCETLRAATDAQNIENVRKAEVQLAEWEGQNGFFATLAKIATASSPETNVDVTVRWMAVVYLKNAINKYWRRSTKNEISSGEKQQIREILLNQFSKEIVPQVELQLAVLLARIARFDCPKDWPQLIPELLNRLQEYMKNINDGKPINVVEHKCILLAFHHVIKALASRRLMVEKRVFEELTGNIYPFVLNMWESLTNIFFHQLKNAPTSDTIINTLERTILVLRTLRKLSIYGFVKPHNNESCMRFIQKLINNLKPCLEWRVELRSLKASPELLALLEKFILKHTKTLVEFQDYHNNSFSTFVPLSLEFTFNYVFHEGTSLIFSENVINFENFVIDCINLMKAILMCEAYTTINNKDNGGGDGSHNITLADFFTENRMIYICEKMLTHYFVLTNSELNSWIENPEIFAQDDVGDGWKYSLRPSIERFYLACIHSKVGNMLAEIKKYLLKAQQIELNAQSPLKDILMKDAIYNAAGLAAMHFYNDINFDEWFRKQLVNELKIDVDSFRILRRRIIWLIGEWESVSFSRDLRPLAYEACLHLLRANEDISIRLTASKTLSILISSFEFLPSAFLPYLEGAFNSLFVLLHEANECETKMNVLNIMGSLVENMSDHIEPLAEGLISYLPALWKESEDYNMLRCAIISTLHQLIKAMYEIHDSLKPFLYNVIALSTNVQEASHIYLMEEGLHLWLVVIQSSGAVSPQLFELSKNLLPILEQSSEYMRTVLLLIEGYILLDAHLYMEHYGRQYVAFCTRMFDDIRPEGIILMLKVYETILRSDPNKGMELLRPSFNYIFKEVCRDELMPIQLSMHLMIVARVLLISQQVFMQVLHEVPIPNAIEKLFDVWIAKIPYICELEKRKLFAIAFGFIFSDNPLVTSRFPDIMQRISETLVDVMRPEDDIFFKNDQDDDEQQREQKKENTIKEDKFYDTLVFLEDTNSTNSSSYFTELEEVHENTFDSRRRLLSLKDPVHQVDLSEYIQKQLKFFKEQIGDEAYQQLMRTVNLLVLEKVSIYIDLGLQKNNQINQN